MALEWIPELARPKVCLLLFDPADSYPVQDYNTVWGSGGQDILLISNLERGSVFGNKIQKIAICKPGNDNLSNIFGHNRR